MQSKLAIVSYLAATIENSIITQARVGAASYIDVLATKDYRKPVEATMLPHGPPIPTSYFPNSDATDMVG